MTVANAVVCATYVASARLASVSPSAGSSQAAAVQPSPGSASAPIAVSVSVAPSTATVRRSSSRTLDIGAASPSSCVGSSPREKLAATPATGASAAMHRNSASPRSPWCAPATATASATATAPSQDSVSEGVAASSRATWPGTPSRVSRPSTNPVRGASSTSSISSQLASIRVGTTAAEAAAWQLPQLTMCASTENASASSTSPRA